MKRKNTSSKPALPEKAGQAMLFLSWKMATFRGFGNTILEKALFYSDRRAYRKSGKPITGLTFVRQHFGPTVEPKQFLTLTAELVQSGKARWDSVRVGRRVQKRLIPLVPLQDGVLSPEEIGILEDVALTLASESATTISKKSHFGLAWRIAKNMEELPPFTALLSEAPIRESDVAWAKAQLGLL